MSRLEAACLLILTNEIIIRHPAVIGKWNAGVTVCSATHASADIIACFVRVHLCTSDGVAECESYSERKTGQVVTDSQH